MVYTKHKILLTVASLLTLSLFAQNVEEVRKANIHSIKLFRKGGQMSMPILRLSEREMLELHFDEVGSTRMNNYFYTMVLCNADWTPANLSPMDYIRGFTQNRIQQYRFSGGSLTRYVHYQVMLPANNSFPTRAGNYLLKVFENADTSKLVFSRRMMVVDERVSIAASIQQPFAQENFRTHQKVVSNININKLDVPSPGRDLTVVVLQNNRWDNAGVGNNPTFIRGKVLEYSAEDRFVFEGGKEWRWLDLRSFRLQ
ncbi:MAG TPA: DUF5103 domain-containing protein, partial [Phnomibacter sp.]|nr:DUF5103 domain-containing protein [Phnomibacter sp.]